MLQVNNLHIIDALENENYNSLSEVIGFGQQYIKDNEDIDMMPGQTTIQIDHDSISFSERNGSFR